MANKKTRFGLGMVFGALAGAVAALFLSPTTGKENREMVAKKMKELKKLLSEREVDKKVKEIFGNTQTASKELFLQTKENVVTQLASVSGAVSSIEKDKYMQAVSDVVEELKESGKISNGVVNRFKTYLASDFEKLKSGMSRNQTVKKVKKVVKSVKKAAPKKAAPRKTTKKA